MAFEVGVLPNWNYTYVGPWNPVINATDTAGNVGVFMYTGSPFTISPAQLSTSIQLIDAKTNQTVTSLYSGETVNIRAAITYPTNAEPVTGFVGPLDSATRGGVVTAMVGYGYYNATSKTFGGGAKNPGTLLGTVAMTYSGANGTWTGQYTATSLPALPAGTLYQVVVTSSDKASPPNTGLGSLNIGPSSGAVAPTTVLTTVVTSQSTTVLTTVPTTTTLVTTVSGSQSATSSSGLQAISTLTLGAATITLIIGVLVGILARRPSK